MWLPPNQPKTHPILGDEDCCYLCEGPCQAERVAADFPVVRLEDGSYERRGRCHSCWARFVVERMVKEREEDEKRAMIDQSPYGISRREVEALAGRLYNPPGHRDEPIPTAEWYNRGILHMHDEQYDRMMAIHEKQQAARRARLNTEARALVERLALPDVANPVVLGSVTDRGEVVLELELSEPDLSDDDAMALAEEVESELGELLELVPKESS